MQHWRRQSRYRVTTFVNSSPSCAPDCLTRRRTDTNCVNLSRLGYLAADLFTFSSKDCASYVRRKGRQNSNASPEAQGLCLRSQNTTNGNWWMDFKSSLQKDFTSDDRAKRAGGSLFQFPEECLSI